MNKEKLMLAMVTVGMLLIVAGIVMPFFMGVDSMPYRYIYAAGALMVLVGRVLNPYSGKSLRLRRLFRIEAWSAIFFCVAAFFMFYPPGNNFRDVLAFTVAGGAIQIYTSIMIPRIWNKEEHNS